MYKLSDLGACEVLRVQDLETISTQYADNKQKTEKGAEKSSTALRKSHSVPPKGSRAGVGDDFVTSLVKFRGAKGRRMFVQLCAIAGCDYVSNVHGVGIMKALKLVLDFKNVDDEKRLLKIARHLRTWKSKVKSPTGAAGVASDYELLLVQAESTFFHARVFTPAEGSQPPV